MPALVFDPGITTGVAVVGPGTVYWTSTTDRLLGLQDAFDMACLQWEIDRVVVEDYRIFPGKLRQHINSQVYPIQVVGAVRLLAYQRGLPVTFLKPSVKAYVPKDAFKEVCPTGITEHEKDAVKLGMYENLRLGA